MQINNCSHFLPFSGIITSVQEHFEKVMLIELQRDNTSVRVVSAEVPPLWHSLPSSHLPHRQTAVVLSFLCKHSIHVLMLHKQFNVYYLLFAFGRHLCIALFTYRSWGSSHMNILNGCTVFHCMDVTWSSLFNGAYLMGFWVVSNTTSLQTVLTSFYI